MTPASESDSFGLFCKWRGLGAAWPDSQLGSKSWRLPAGGKRRLGETEPLSGTFWAQVDPQETV